VDIFFQYSIGGLIYNSAQSNQNGQSTYYNQVHTLPTGAAPQPPPLVRTSNTSNVNLTANLRYGVNLNVENFALLQKFLLTDLLLLILDHLVDQQALLIW